MFDIIYLLTAIGLPPGGSSTVELVRNLVAHGDAREGKWRGNWRMEWVASTLTPPPNVVYPALLKLTRTPRLPAVDWTDAPTDLNGLVRFGERRNLVSARVPSGSAPAMHIYTQTIHRTTQNKQYIEQHKNFRRVRAVPTLGELYPGICLTTEEKARKNLSQFHAFFTSALNVGDWYGS